MIKDIFSCEKTFSSSLHGLIVSHAYNIPCVWVEFLDKVIGNGFKFKDYLKSVNLDEYKPAHFRNEIPEFEDLMKLFDDKKFNIDINLKPLEKACPFN